MSSWPSALKPIDVIAPGPRKMVNPFDGYHPAVFTRAPGPGTLTAAHRENCVDRQLAPHLSKTGMWQNDENSLKISTRQTVIAST
jgi:hypothetical protein